MALFELQGPDGANYEIDAPDEASAVAAFRKLMAPKSPPLPRAKPEVTTADRLAVARNLGPRGQGATDFNVDDVVRSVASGATFGLADEIAAGGNALLGIGNYSDNVAAERARDAQIPADVRFAGELAGGVLTGSGLAKSGVTLLNTANPTVGNMALRGAGEGAAYGAAYVFGSGEGTQDRIEKAAFGAAVGAPTGGVMGAVAGKVAQTGGPKPPSTRELRTQANAAYKTAEQAGVVVNQPSFSNTVGNIRAVVDNAGIDPTIHPKATAALKRLEDAATGDITLKKMDVLRRVLGSAAKSTDADERRIASMMIDELDTYIQGLQPGDLVSGNAQQATAALTEARDLWSKMAKSSTIESMIERAKDRAGQYSQSGMENALRTEFRQLAMNAKKMRGFSPEEQEAIKAVSAGGPLVNMLRLIGKMAPRGVVSGGFNLGVAAAADPTFGVATMAAGEVGKRSAEYLTRRNALMAAELMRGGRGPQAQLTPAQETILRGLMIGEAEQSPRLQPSFGPIFSTAQ